jgi:hypothetical protein
MRVLKSVLRKESLITLDKLLLPHQDPSRNVILQEETREVAFHKAEKSTCSTFYIGFFLVSAD